MNNLQGNDSQQQPPVAGNNNAQKEDYLDKGLDAAEKKWGGAAGQDTQKNRAVNEKIVSRSYSSYCVSSIFCVCGGVVGLWLVN